MEDRGLGTNNASTRKVHLITSYIAPSVKRYTHTNTHTHRKRTREGDRPYIHFVSLGRLYILAKGFKDITVGVKWVLKI